MKSEPFSFRGGFWHRRRVLNAAVDVVLRSVRNSYLLHPVYPVRNHEEHETNC